MSSKVMPFTWIVRLDVAPMWVADGFNLSDQRALEMLGKTLGYANMSTELAARVLSAPPALRIAREMGYGPKHHQAKSEIETIKADASHAYVNLKGKFDGMTLDKAIADAIALLDSVAFVRDEKDDTAMVLSKLREAQSMLRGSTPISDIKWEPSKE